MPAPVVVVDRPLSRSVWDRVFFDGYLASYQATEALIKGQNKTIGIITGNLEMKLARERIEGYMQAMKDFHIPISDEIYFKRRFYNGDSL